MNKSITKRKGIQVDLSREDRTKEQNDIIEWCYGAVEILKDNGYNCYVNKYFVTKPTEDPCSIIIVDKV